MSVIIPGLKMPKNCQDCKCTYERYDGSTICSLGYCKERAEDAIRRNALKELPPVPKTGYWINVEDRTDWYDATYKCSCCGREIMTPFALKDNLYNGYPYCHCGAKMVKPQERENEE